MVKAKAGDRVKFHYTKKSQDGAVMDTSKYGQPLEIRVGSRLVPLFEDAVLGLEKGAKKEITIPLEKAYGRYNETLVYELDRTQFVNGTPPGWVKRQNSGDGMELLLKELLPESMKIKSY